MSQETLLYRGNLDEKGQVENSGSLGGTVHENATTIGGILKTPSIEGLLDAIQSFIDNDQGDLSKAQSAYLELKKSIIIGVLDRGKGALHTIDEHSRMSDIIYPQLGLPRRYTHLECDHSLDHFFVHYLNKGCSTEIPIRTISLKGIKQDLPPSEFCDEFDRIMRY